MSDDIKPFKQSNKCKYVCDHNFFSRDNEQSFYWAGFLAADGCAFESKDKHLVVLSLAKADVDQLLAFKNAVKFDGKIGESIYKHSLNNSKWKDSIKNGISITSNKMFNDLARFNIIPRKTHIYSMPQWLINHPLINHFIRGYFDGDGCIWFHKRPSIKDSIEFRGTEILLRQIKNIFEREIAINSKVQPRLNNGINQIKFSGNRICLEISNFIYKDASVYMRRKYDKCKLITSQRKKYINRIITLREGESI